MIIFSPRVLLHVEGLVALIIACTLYAIYGFSWVIFAALFFAPDLSMLGYVANKKVGALCYNVFHTYSVPLLIGLALFYIGKPSYLGVMLIWSAHIGFDRLMGYGIKYETAFKDTHLQRV